LRHAARRRRIDLRAGIFYGRPEDKESRGAQAHDICPDHILDRLELGLDGEAAQSDSQAGIRLWNNSRAHASAGSGAHERNAKILAEPAPVRRGRIPNSTLLIQSRARLSAGRCEQPRAPHRRATGLSVGAQGWGSFEWCDAAQSATLMRRNMRTAGLVALVALAIGFAGIPRASSIPLRQHCGPDAHRNAWGRCVPDRLRSCPAPEWHRNRLGLCVRKKTLAGSGSG
jgi:hypothetical protein